MDEYLFTDPTVGDEFGVSEDDEDDGSGEDDDEGMSRITNAYDARSDDGRVGHIV